MFRDLYKRRMNTKIVHRVKYNDIHKKCKKCGSIKPLSEYTVSIKKENFHFYQNKCKQCRASIRMVKYNEEQNKDLNLSQDLK